MQKKIIALAVAGLVSGGAFAQSSVTISGLFDVGYQNFKTQAGSLDTTVQHIGSSSNAGTTNVTFKAEEALGGGMKVGVLLETDPAAGTSTGGAFMNSQNYLWLSGNFGNLKLGFFNNQPTTVAAAVSQPFGTGLGGGYNGAFGRLDGYNVIGVPAAVAGVADAASVTDVATHGGAGARDIRINNAMEYTTPTFSGFNANFLLKTQNSNGTAASNDGQTGLGLNYGNGPVKLAYAFSQLNGVIGGTIANQLTHNLLGGNFTFGPVTVYGGWTSSKSTLNAVAGTAGNVDSRSWNLALKWQATPNLWLGANVLRVDDKLTGNQDRDLNALGANYSMSKRTTAYVRYENGDNDKANSVSGNFTRLGAGLMHTF